MESLYVQRGTRTRLGLTSCPGPQQLLPLDSVAPTSIPPILYVLLAGVSSRLCYFFSSASQMAWVSSLVLRAAAALLLLQLLLLVVLLLVLMYCYACTYIWYHVNLNGPAVAPTHALAVATKYIDDLAEQQPAYVLIIPTAIPTGTPTAVPTDGRLLV